MTRSRRSAKQAGTRFETAIAAALVGLVGLAMRTLPVSRSLPNLVRGTTATQAAARRCSRPDQPAAGRA
jgi:hypothetical protein